ncbi:hypothetical protein V8E36_007075 [Tilletia maclaganii]
MSSNSTCPHPQPQQQAHPRGDEVGPLDPDTQDLGWAVYEQDVPQPLLSGMKNKDLWQLERRYNNQTFAVKRVDDDNSPHLLNGLDCNIAENHQFTPDRLRSTLERFYTSVILSLAAFAKHRARLRSWHEARRTALFTASYAIAWAFDKALVSILLLLILLIVSPRSRRVLFPPAPLPAISATSGKPKVPEAQHLASTQSLTGAAESYQGQAAEREAANFVNSISSLAVSTAIGSEDGRPASTTTSAEDDDTNTVVDHQDAAGAPATRKATTTRTGTGALLGSTKKDTKSAPGTLDDNVIPDPSRIGAAAAPKAGTNASQPAHGDQTAAPVDNAVWFKAAPVLYVLEDICDTFERFGNALSPVPPFAQNVPRLRLASVLVPLLLGTTLLNPNLVYRSTTGLLGFLFFGQPVLDRLKPEPMIAWLDAHIPHWRRYLELRNTLLRGIPTNAQLTVTLLRIGEAHKSPLPPPPLPVAPGDPSQKLPEAEVREGEEMADHPDLPPEYREALRRQALEREAERQAAEAAEEDDKNKKKDKKKPSKILGFFKVAAKSATASALGLNRAEATVLQSDHAKARLGVVRKQLAQNALGDGPAAFKARYKGKKGLIIVSTSSTTPCVSFEPRQPAVARAAIAALDQFKEDEKSGGESGAVASTSDVGEGKTEGEGQGEGKSSVTKRALEKTAEAARVPPLFSIQIEDIAELNKRGGLGWKAKMLVSWAMESDIADGLDIVTLTGERFRVTAMPRRDEVFNRLIAISPKTKWVLA